MILLTQQIIKHFSDWSLPRHLDRILINRLAIAHIIINIKNPNHHNKQTDPPPYSNRPIQNTYTFIYLSINYFYFNMTQQSRVQSRDEKQRNINSLISVSNGKNGLGEKSTKQIEQWLEAEAKILLDKKERNVQKQERLKEIEDKYEVDRIKKQKNIQEKLLVSAKNKNKTIETLQKKLGQYSNRHKSVYNKVISENKEDLEKNLDARKVYINQDLKQSSRFSQSGELTANSKSGALQRQPKQLGGDEIDKKVQQINLRIQFAHQMQKQRQKSVLNRIREHNTSEIQMAQQKMAKELQKQTNHFSHKIASKFQGSDLNIQKYNKSLQKKQQQKKKAYNEKLRVFQINLRQLQSNHASKLDELNQKLEKNISNNKSFRDEKNEIYYRKFMENSQILEQKKISRADRIIQKHQEIKMKNKVYKEKKDSLFKAIKCEISNG